MDKLYFEAKGEELLKRLGIKKAEFARRMGVQRQNVNALFKTKNLEIIRKASDVLRVPFELLVGYAEPIDLDEIPIQVPLSLDLLCSSPVCVLTGHEFEPVEGKTFVGQVSDCFMRQGGCALSPFGEVVLDKRGVKSSFHHGMSVAKRCAFAGVKDVLERGAVILPMGHNGDGKKEQTGMVAAPVMIAGERYVCVVVVIYNLQIRRLYVHEAFITKKLLAVVATSLPSEEESSLAQPQGDVAKVLTEFLNSK